MCFEKRPCLRAFMDETALPSGVTGPRDLAPLRRACSDLDLRDIRLGTPTQDQYAWGETTCEGGLDGVAFRLSGLGG